MNDMEGEKKEQNEKSMLHQTFSIKESSVNNFKGYKSSKHSTTEQSKIHKNRLVVSSSHQQK